MKDTDEIDNAENMETFVEMLLEFERDNILDVILPDDKYILWDMPNEINANRQSIKKEIESSLEPNDFAYVLRSSEHNCLLFGIYIISEKKWTYMEFEGFQMTYSIFRTF